MLSRCHYPAAAERGRAPKRPDGGFGWLPKFEQA
jgi:hypothetical protein